MTTQPDHVLSITIPPASAPGTARSATAPAGVPALLSPVSCPGTPPGTTVPGVLAAGGVGTGEQLVRITRLANAAPGKPDGEVDTARWSLCGSEPGPPAVTSEPWQAPQIRPTAGAPRTAPAGAPARAGDDR
jgi:hypothetical protein